MHIVTQTGALPVESGEGFLYEQNQKTFSALVGQQKVPLHHKPGLLFQAQHQHLPDRDLLAVHSASDD